MGMVMPVKPVELENDPGFIVMTEAGIVYAPEVVIGAIINIVLVLLNRIPS